MPICQRRRGYAMIMSHIVNGFVLGLSLGGTCLVTCGPVYAPYLMMRQVKPLRSVLALLEISGGRLIAYAAVGAVVGWLGLQFAPGQKDVVVAVGYALVAAMLLTSAYGEQKKSHRCAVPRVTKITHRPFVLGLVTGINLCPPFLGAVVSAADLSGPLAGALVFTAFFAGSTVWLLPVTTAGREQMRRVAMWGAVLVGIWFAVQSGIMAFNLIRQIPAAEQPVTDTHPVVSMLDVERAVLLVDDTLRYRMFHAMLQEHRGGTTILANTVSAIGSTPYVIVSPTWCIANGIADSTLKKPGRFVVVLPDISEREPDLEWNRHVVGFLTNYLFRFNKETGSFFRMNRNRVSASR